MRGWPLASLLVGLAAVGEPSPQSSQAPGAGSWLHQSAAARAERLKDLRAVPLGARLVEVSAGFLGTPYQVSPLGEGGGRDPDPLIRYDAVVCLTFVEETLALSLATSTEAVVPVLSSLRYQKEVAYEDRNHLMEAQWIPNNVAKGYLRDVTRIFGARAVVSTQKILTPASWRSSSSRVALRTGTAARRRRPVVS